MLDFLPVARSDLVGSLSTKLGCKPIELVVLTEWRVPCAGTQPAVQGGRLRQAASVQLPGGAPAPVLPDAQGAKHGGRPQPALHLPWCAPNPPSLSASFYLLFLLIIPDPKHSLCRFECLNNVPTTSGTLSIPRY